MSLEPSEVFFITVLVISVLLAPGTKVEESFNLQATHDFLFVAPWNVDQFDHRQFPGVVPRTFVGPLLTAMISAPFSFFWRIFNSGKVIHLIFARLALGFTYTVVFLKLADTIREKFGNETAMFFRLICASQFHLMFYASRTLPNTFAMILVLMVFRRLLDEEYLSAVTWATLCVFLFRFETILLFGPLFIVPIAEGSLPLLGYRGAVIQGIRTLMKIFAFTVPFDSFMWGRILWPEGGVIWFNIIENRSSEYGVLPFLWYFLNGLPRSLLATIFLIPFGCLVETRVHRYVFAGTIFIFLMSFLPHKELRFVLYAFPFLNLSAAVLCARTYISRERSPRRGTLSFLCTSHILANLICTMLFLYVATSNYPGFHISSDLHWRYRIDQYKSVSVYVDNAVAQTGHSRFTEMYSAWTYNKTERLPVEELKNFDFIMMGTYGLDLPNKVRRIYSKTHKLVNYAQAYHNFKISHWNGIPVPVFGYANKAVLMVRNGYM